MSLTDADKPLTIEDWYDTEVMTDVAAGLQPERPAGSGRLLRKIGKLAAAGVLAAIPLAGMAEGAYAAATDFPTTMNLGDPGLNVDVSAQLADHTDISFGASGTLRLPAAHHHEPLLGDVAAKVTVREVDIAHPDQSDAEALLPLVEDHGRDLQQRITTAVAWRAGEGAASGLGAGILTDLALLAGVNWLKSEDKKLARKQVAVGLAAASLVVGPLVMAHARDNVPASPQIMTAIDPSLAELSPILHNASFSGTGGKGANKLIELAFQTKAGADKTWQYDYQQVAAEIDRLAGDGKLPWLGDPNTIAAMQVTDAHGNYPFMKYYLPQLIRKLQINVVMLTGDQENTGNTTPIDTYAWEFLSGIQPKHQNGRTVRVVYAGGNHDPLHLQSSVARLEYRDSGGNPYHPVVSLDKDNNYTTHVDGLTFVGSPDLNRTTTGNTAPFQLADQLKNDATQGEQLADVACASKALEGHSPIVLTHEESAGYASLLQGCASVALSGHLHMTSPIQAYEAGDGSTEYLQNLGSASGDGPDNWKAVYSGPTVESAVSVWLFDATSGQPTGQLMINVFPSKAPKVSLIKLPDATKTGYPWDNDSIRQYVQTYEPHFDASSIVTSR